MNKFRCKKCRKTLFFYPDNVGVSDNGYESIVFHLKCPNSECGFINKIKLSKRKKPLKKNLGVRVWDKYPPLKIDFPCDYSLLGKIKKKRKDDIGKYLVK